MTCGDLGPKIASVINQYDQIWLRACCAIEIQQYVNNDNILMKFCNEQVDISIIGMQHLHRRRWHSASWQKFSCNKMNIYLYTQYKKYLGSWIMGPHDLLMVHAVKFIFNLLGSLIMYGKRTKQIVNSKSKRKCVCIIVAVRMPNN